MGKITLEVVESINDHGLKGIEFDFTIPGRPRVPVGGFYFSSWSERARREHIRRAESFARPIRNQKCTIYPEAENKMVQVCLEDAPLLLVASELLAQKLFLGILTVSNRMDIENTALDVLYDYIRGQKIWFEKQPAWFHLEQRTTSISVCPNVKCRQSDLTTHANDTYCGKCGKKRIVHSTPVLKETVYTCTDESCDLHKQAFNPTYKKCYECGKDLGHVSISRW